MKMLWPQHFHGVECPFVFSCVVKKLLTKLHCESLMTTSGETLTLTLAKHQLQLPTTFSCNFQLSFNLLSLPELLLRVGPHPPTDFGITEATILLLLINFEKKINFRVLDDFHSEQVACKSHCIDICSAVDYEACHNYNDNTSCHSLYV